MGKICFLFVTQRSSNNTLYIMFQCIMYHIVFTRHNSPEAISTPFGSGCSATITQAVNENRRGGHRAFLGFFDPSARPYVESNVLSFTIPMSRFKEMCETMRICSLDTHAWGKIKARIDEG